MQNQTKSQNNCIHCENCNSDWFEEISVAQFSNGRSIPIGNVPHEALLRFTLLRCIQCGKVNETNVYRLAADPRNKEYDAAKKAVEAGSKAAVTKISTTKV